MGRRTGVCQLQPCAQEGRVNSRWCRFQEFVRPRWFPNPNPPLEKSKSNLCATLRALSVPSTASTSDSVCAGKKSSQTRRTKKFAIVHRNQLRTARSPNKRNNFCVLDQPSLRLSRLCGRPIRTGNQPARLVCHSSTERDSVDRRVCDTESVLFVVGSCTKSKLLELGIDNSTTRACRINSTRDLNTLPQCASSPSSAIHRPPLTCHGSAFFLRCVCCFVGVHVPVCVLV